MNAALDNCIKKEDEIITFSGGKFGQRWHEIASSLGINAHHHKTEWGDSISAETVLDEIKKYPKLKAICIQHCETSTGIMYPLNDILNAVKDYNQEILTFVDGITSIGVTPINFDSGLIDVLVCGSQKALMLPPGLSMITLSDKAWKIAEQKNRSQYYWNLNKERKGQNKGISQWTPATTLVIGLRKSLELIENEGYENLYKRHLELASFTRKELQNLGFTLYAKSHPAPGLTAVITPCLLYTSPSPRD